MKFTLTYDGPLVATQGDPRCDQVEKVGRATVKHQLRRAFHCQLRELWRTNPFLSKATAWRTDYNPAAVPGDREPLVDIIADMHNREGFRFVPLVRDEWFLHCALDVLILRRDPVGSGLNAGDVDNRLKTLIDGLRMPKGAQEIPGIAPLEGEDPFFVLLVDDSNVSEFHVRTNRLLEPATAENSDLAWVKMIVGVEITPYHGTTFNSMFDYA